MASPGHGEGSDEPISHHNVSSIPLVVSRVAISRIGPSDGISQPVCVRHVTTPITWYWMSPAPLRQGTRHETGQAKASRAPLQGRYDVSELSKGQVDDGVLTSRVSGVL